MSRLISLYPAAWRARYGEELHALLDERPPSLGDRLDLVRGALDARLHPELLDGGPGDLEMAPEGRAPGLAAIAGGLTWTLMAFVIGLATMGRANGDITSLFWITIFLMTVGLIGPLPSPRARQIRRGLVAGAVLLAVGLALPWDLKVFAALPLVLLVGAGLRTVATLRAGLSTGGRVLVVGFTFVAPFLVLGAGTVGLIDAGPANDWVQGLVVAPYGLAWVVLGALMVRRGRSAPADPTSPPGPTEAPAV